MHDLSMTGITNNMNDQTNNPTMIGQQSEVIELGGGYTQRDVEESLTKRMKNVTAEQQRMSSKDNDDNFDAIVGTKTFTRQLVGSPSGDNQSEIAAGIDQEMFNF